MSDGNVFVRVLRDIASWSLLRAWGDRGTFVERVVCTLMILSARVLARCMVYVEKDGAP